MDIAGIGFEGCAYSAGSGRVAGRGSSFSDMLAGALADAPCSGEQNSVARQSGCADASATQEADQGEYPLEAYRIPNWYVELTGGYNLLTTELGMSAEEARTKYEGLSRDEQADYDEYAGILSDYYREELANAGISSGDVGDYYHNFLQNESTQERVRQAVCDRLAGNSRAVELMQYFGIQM